MTSVPATATDAELIAFIDGWAALLEREEFELAFELTGHIADMRWTPALLREVIKGYGDARSAQRVTLHGVPTDVTQKKEVTRWATERHGFFGELWYDLNIDGKATDLTATFSLKRAGGRVTFHLNDVHVR